MHLRVFLATAHLTLVLLPWASPSFRDLIGFSKLNGPAHRYLCLRFKRHLAMPPAMFEHFRVHRLARPTSIVYIV